jgi:hypothetical protein
MNPDAVEKAIELNKKIMADLDKLKAENERLRRELVPRLKRHEAELRRAGYLR